MRTLVTSIIRKRNPHFAFHPDLTTPALVEMLLIRALAFVRSYKLLLRFYIPHKLFLGAGVSFRHLHNIQIGKWVRIEDHVYLHALGNGKLSIGNNSGIGAYSRIVVSTTYDKPGAFIHIGNNVGIGEFAYLGGAGGLTIGNDCIIGQYFSCHPENHRFDDPETLIRYQSTTRKGITIGSNCWIGSKVTVLDGVSVGNNCVIAAGAVITQNIPDNSVAGGVPARVLKSTTGINKAA